MPTPTPVAVANATAQPAGIPQLTRLEALLLAKDTPTFPAYYNGKMSYSIYGRKWEASVKENFPDLANQTTSENIYKSVIDLYAENIMPIPKEMSGFSNVIVRLLATGQAAVLIDNGGTAHFPEHQEIITDGAFTVAAIYTRSIARMTDYVTFAYTDGRTRLFAKAVPQDLSAPGKEDYEFVEEQYGNQLFTLALDDKGFGSVLASLQDRLNHSIIDQTVVAEMYARPFWYLLNTELPVVNPYMPAAPVPEGLQEQKVEGAGGRVFTTSSAGPFGQLEPPTISDMIAYHDSIQDKVSQVTGIPQFYFKPGSGTPPTGVALKVLSKRFNNKISRMRDDLREAMSALADALGVKRTLEKEGEPNEHELWNTEDDLLQESMDAHGLALAQMGYPLNYIAEVVTPGVDLEDYEDDSLGEQVTAVPGQPTDMTAMGQQGLTATPGQVAAYGANPGQRAK